jgi:hypothetical protein
MAAYAQDAVNQKFGFIAPLVCGEVPGEVNVDLALRDGKLDANLDR